MRVCLAALVGNVAWNMHHRALAVRSQSHWERGLKQKALGGWLQVFTRRAALRHIVNRSCAASDQRRVQAAFRAWHLLLLRAVREALTEQVLDLKRELMHAVAWSD
jgi:hypothetical protein